MGYRIILKLNRKFSFRKYGFYIGYVIVLVLLVIVVYRQDLWLLYNEAVANESHSHILLVPFFTVFLLYLKRDVVKSMVLLNKSKNEDSLFGSLFGLVIIIMALCLYWYGSHKFNFLEYHVLSLPILFIGVTLFLFNQEATIILVYPLLFLLFLLPPPLRLVYIVGGKLANINTYLSFVVLKAFRLPVVLSYDYGPPSLILESLIKIQTAFTIDEPCSGIYTLMSFVLFASFLIMISKTSIPRKVLLFIMGFIIFDVLNVLRIILIIFVAHFYNVQFAMSLFHVFAGFFLIFIGMMITFFISDRLLDINFVIDGPSLDCPQCSVYEGKKGSFCLDCGSYLDDSDIIFDKIFLGKMLSLVIFCVVAVVSINVPALTTASSDVGIGSIMSMENATNVLPEVDDYKLLYLYRDVEYERVANQDASLVYAYHPRRIPSNRSSVFVTVGVADTISNLHSWEVCLITLQTSQGRQPLVEVLEERDVILRSDTSKEARYIVFLNEDQMIQNILYWYEKAAFSYGLTLRQKYVRISLIIFQDNADSFSEVEDELFEVGREITAFWEPIKRQSLISLGVPALQLSLIILAVSAVVIRTMKYAKEYSLRTTNQILFQRIGSEEDKGILLSVQNMGGATFQVKDIRDAVFEDSGQELSLEGVYDYLSRFEKYGLLQKKVLDIDNSPKIFWKLY